MNSKSRFTRRRFLKAGSLSVAGFMVTCSTPLGARTMRSLVEQARPRVKQPRFLPNPGEWDSNQITAAWLGHSTVLLNFYGVTILTDPVLFKRIGANTRVGTIGLKRLVASPLAPAELPAVDLVLISHAHMDHLDPASLRVVPGKPRTLTAHDTTDLLPWRTLGKAQGLSWGDKVRVKTGNGDLQVRAFEVRHWGARWRYDTFRGYNGYVISREGKHIIFGGDTAMVDTFPGLKRHGPFELAIMPVGAYQPHIRSHCTPEQAVTMANQAGAKYFVPIHFKTFPLGQEGTVEPLERLQDSIEPDRLGWTDVGQTFVATQPGKRLPEMVEPNGFSGPSHIDAGAGHQTANRAKT